MGTEQNQIIERLTSLKIIVPSNINLSPYLKNSPRFNSYEFTSFEDLRKFTADCFNVDFEILYIGQQTINDNDLEGHDCVAFLSVNDDKLGESLKRCTDLGIPIIFLKYAPDMDCDTINLENKEGECFKYRPSCCKNASDHCEHRFFEGINKQFDHRESTIYKVKETFNIESIPIFTMGFLIDFLIWYGTFGITLRKKRDKFIKARTEADIIFSDSTEKSIFSEMALKSLLKQRR